MWKVYLSQLFDSFIHWIILSDSKVTDLVTTGNRRWFLLTKITYTL